jgi:hypothetical protein
MGLKKMPFQIYLDARDSSLLERLARRLGLSKAETVREAVRRWVADVEAVRDPLLELIGSLDDPDLPADLSTRHDGYAVEGYAARRGAEPRGGKGGRR